MIERSRERRSHSSHTATIGARKMCDCSASRIPSEMMSHSGCQLMATPTVRHSTRECVVTELPRLASSSVHFAAASPFGRPVQSRRPRIGSVRPLTYTFRTTCARGATSDERADDAARDDGAAADRRAGQDHAVVHHGAVLDDRARGDDGRSFEDGGSGHRRAVHDASAVGLGVHGRPDRLQIRRAILDADPCRVTEVDRSHPDPVGPGGPAGTAPSCRSTRRRECAR